MKPVASDHTISIMFDYPPAGRRSPYQHSSRLVRHPFHRLEQPPSISAGQTRPRRPILTEIANRGAEAVHRGQRSRLGFGGLSELIRVQELFPL